MDRLNVVLTIYSLFISRASCIYLNSTSLKQSSNPAIWTEEGIWGPLLEEWTIGNHREKRVMTYHQMEEKYVLIDRSGDVIPKEEDKEGKIAPGKIVTNSQKAPAAHQVSETDLYLLGAIEKLVYRVDTMEKRLRRVEEMMYYVMAGNRIDQEPCRDNFTRIGMNCYHFSANAGREADWKTASKFCKRSGGFLLEMESIEENQDIIEHIQGLPFLKGKDFWTGGLNPGLLWIWSNSARPVNVPGASSTKNGINVPGDGRCLRLSYDKSTKTYGYRGTDCGARYSFICELPETTASNEIRRIGRNKNILSDF